VRLEATALNAVEIGEAYTSRFRDTWKDDDEAARIRFVVLDSETTGLDPRKDRLVTIGAVAVRAGEIDLADSFEALLRVAYNTSAVTVHGVTRDTSLAGFEEPEALLRFLAYLRDGVIVGHHIHHDIETLNAGYERHFGFRLQNRSLDTMDLSLHLERDGAFDGREAFESFSLDALCDRFGVIPHDRHTAPGDAFLTAQVFLRQLRFARASGRTTLRQLTEPWTPEQ
jgi:DNA polymerase-3 subunit epsilon